MNSLRKVGGLLVVLMLVGFALPGSAQNLKRTYSLNVTTPLDAGVVKPFTVRVANTSPDGISAFKAIKLIAPANISSIASAQLSSPYTAAAFSPTYGQESDGRKNVTFEYISPPVKSVNDTSNNGQWNVTVSMTVTSLCAFTGGDWNADVRTGSTLSGGQQFTRVQTVGDKEKTELGLPCSVSLNYNANPTEGGSVSCGAVAYNTTTTCGASPTGGWKFSGWTGTAGGTCTGMATSCTTQTLTSSTPYTLVGSFTKNSVTSSVSPGSSGSVSCTESSTTAGQYTCTATNSADNQWGFKNWSSSPAGACSGTTSPCTFMATADTTVTAVFGQFTIATAVNPPGTGFILCSPNPVGYGLNATCTATAGDGYIFDGFTGNCTGDTCTLNNVTSAKSVTANFKSARLDCVNGSNLVSSPGSNYDPIQDVAFVGGAGWGLRRGANTDNTLGTVDGKACNELVDVAVTRVGNTWTVISDKTDVATATYYYVFVGEKVQVDQTGSLAGYSAKRPWLSWGVADPSAAFGAPDWVPALMCKQDPVDMSTMTAAELLALLPEIPNVAPFNDTSKYPQTDADSSKNRPQYKPGVLARACISQQGSTSIIYEGGVVKVQYWHKVVDQVDLKMGYE